MSWLRHLLGDVAIQRVSFDGADQTTLDQAIACFPEARVINGQALVYAPTPEPRILMQDEVVAPTAAP